MKFQFLFWFLSVSLMLSCSNSPQQNNTAEKSIKNKSLPKQKPASNYHDTLKINSTSAVFYYPDSLQLEKIRSVTDSGVFEGSMHEYYNYMRNAHLVIIRDRPGLKIIDVKNARYLLFISSDKKKECVDLDTKSEPYGLFFFNKQKPAEFVDMANIESELGFYFAR